MKSQFLDTKIFNNFEFPMQKLMELNAKMMQNLYARPMYLLDAKKPEEILEKQLELFVHNSNMALKYMRDSLNILENHWVSVSHNIDTSTKRMMDETLISTQKISPSVAKKPSSSRKKLSSKAKSSKLKASASKPSIKKNVKAASPSKSPAKKTKKHLAKSIANQPKSTIIHAKKPMSSHAKNMNSITDKNAIKNLGLQQHLTKSNQLSKPN